MTEPKTEEAFRNDKLFVRCSLNEEGVGSEEFYFVEVQEWSLVEEVRKGGKRGLKESVSWELVPFSNITETGRTCLQGAVKSRDGKHTMQLRTYPVETWTVQRLQYTKYRVWLKSTISVPIKGHMKELWFLLSTSSSAHYKTLYEPMRKKLQYFTPLLSVVGQGPPNSAEAAWHWPKTMKWDDIDADVILRQVEEMQPGARKVLESDPEFVMQHFLETLEEDEYAGVHRDFCKPDWLTLFEYFEKGIEDKGKFPQKPIPVEGVAGDAEMARALGERGSDEVAGHVADADAAWFQRDDFEDSALKKVKCRICHRDTVCWDGKDKAGLQHFAYFRGKKRQLTEPTAPCDAAPPPDRKSHKENPKKSSKKTSMKCALCKKEFMLSAEKPEKQEKLAVAFEEHLNQHLTEQVDRNMDVHLANQLRIRAAIEGLL